MGDQLETRPPDGVDLKSPGVDNPAGPEMRSPGADELDIENPEIDKPDADSPAADN